MHWKNPFGYLMTSGIQFAATACILAVNVQFFCFFFGSCWLFISIANDITKELTDFNVVVKSSDGNHPKLTKRFCDLVQVYSDAKQ